MMALIEFNAATWLVSDGQHIEARTCATLQDALQMCSFLGAGSKVISSRDCLYNTGEIIVRLDKLPTLAAYPQDQFKSPLRRTLQQRMKTMTVVTSCPTQAQSYAI